MEFFENEPISLFLQDMKLLESFHSDRQRVVLYQHNSLGKILIINNEIQHIEFFQQFYHEQLVHLPIAFIPQIKTALIIGGGSLFAAYEILKYPTIEKIVLCDYDHTVLELMKKYYPHANLVISNPKFHYVEQDAHSFLLEHIGKYDLIVNDCFNLSLESQLHNISYYKLLLNFASEKGVCTDVIYKHIFEINTTRDSLKLLNDEDISYKLSLITIPEYPGIFHLQTIWSEKGVLKNIIEKPINEIQNNFLTNKNIIRYNMYSPKHLSYYFYIPTFIKNLFNEIR